MTHANTANRPYPAGVTARPAGTPTKHAAMRAPAALCPRLADRRDELAAEELDRVEVVVQQVLEHDPLHTGVGQLT